MSAFQVNVTPGSGTPIYRQIVDQVRLGLATGALAPGDAMPSVRSLADRLVVNPNTVARAYADLVRDGVLDSHQGRGVFVANTKRQVYSRAERLRRLQQALEAFGPDGALLGFSAAPVPPAAAGKL